MPLLPSVFSREFVFSTENRKVNIAFGIVAKVNEQAV